METHEYRSKTDLIIFVRPKRIHLDSLDNRYTSEFDDQKLLIYIYVQFEIVRRIEF